MTVWGFVGGEHHAHFQGRQRLGLPGQTGSCVQWLDLRRSTRRSGKIAWPPILDRPLLQLGRLDEAARAGWLYFVAGNTQDQIALGAECVAPVSATPRLPAVSERLVTFRLQHPIRPCMELAERLSEQFGLAFCEVVPTDPTSNSVTVGIAEAASAFLEARLGQRKTCPLPALGTGRAMRAAVDQMPRMNCPNHQLVSMVGNIAP